MSIDEVYVNFWGKPKAKFTEMELAIMEGGNSLEEYYEKTSNSSNSSNAGRMQFIKGLDSSKMGRQSKPGNN